MRAALQCSFTTMNLAIIKYTKMMRIPSPKPRLHGWVDT